MRKYSRMQMITKNVNFDYNRINAICYNYSKNAATVGIPKQPKAVLGGLISSFVGTLIGLVITVFNKTI